MHFEAKSKLKSDLHLETEIERVWRCVKRPRSSNCEIRLGPEMKFDSEMHLEVVIERLWRSCN